MIGEYAQTVQSGPLTCQYQERGLSAALKRPVAASRTSDLILHPHCGNLFSPFRAILANHWA